MLEEAASFFLLAIVAAFFAFTGIAGGLSSTTAWEVLAVFAALFILSLIVRRISSGGYSQSFVGEDRNGQSQTQPTISGLR